MKKITVLIFFLSASFVACNKLNKEDYKVFSYDENISQYGTFENNQKNWNLSCDNLNCKITYSVGTPLKVFYEKEVVLNNEEKKKDIVVSLIKGIKKGKNYSGTQDYKPSNHFISNNRKEYYGETENKEFYKILSTLFEKNYKNIVRKYEK